MKQGARVTLARILLLAVVSSVAPAAVFQYELLGRSDEWLVIRENIPTSGSEKSACTYPRLDPSEYSGVRVHFVRVTADAKLAKLIRLETSTDSMAHYAPGPNGQACTSAAEAQEHWKAISARAQSLGIDLPGAAPAPVILGKAVDAKSCSLAGAERVPCRRLHRQQFQSGPIQIAVLLTAVAQSPDNQTCQFVGHRFGAAIQVTGLEFGSQPGSLAPGGFADHYDCRSQEFRPMRLYVMGGAAVLIASFKGTNIADRDEYPFFLVFPTEPVQ
ncbi:MAG TPA: hypothetical protein VEQ63_14240 [Bryobacteraceae bacterium]|nr:hypothetical protein [Bryobacteraceae bacterium]